MKIKASDQKPISLERGTPTLGNVTGVFRDRFIFWHILEPFSPRKWNLRSVYERIRSIRSQKLKRNVIKWEKYIIFRSVGFADWFMGLKTFSKYALKNALKINWSKKTPSHKYTEVAHSRLWAPTDQTMTYPLGPVHTSYFTCDESALTQMSEN